jgi:hypothetical protein
MNTIARPIVAVAAAIALIATVFVTSSSASAQDTNPYARSTEPAGGVSLAQNSTGVQAFAAAATINTTSNDQSNPDGGIAGTRISSTGTDPEGEATVSDGVGVQLGAGQADAFVSPGPAVGELSATALVPNAELVGPNGSLVQLIGATANAQGNATEDGTTGRARAAAGIDTITGLDGALEVSRLGIVTSGQCNAERSTTITAESQSLNGEEMLYGNQTMTADGRFLVTIARGNGFDPFNQSALTIIPTDPAAEGFERIDLGIASVSTFCTPQPAATSPVCAAFIVREDTFPDALTAAPVAASVGAPLLLAGQAGMNTGTLDTLQSLSPQLVVIVGGNAALSPALEAQVSQQAPGAEVRRISGTDRTGTANALALTLANGDLETVCPTG